MTADFAAGLRRRGSDVQTSQDDGADRRHDERLWERASELGWVHFSQDDDLLVLAAKRHEQSRAFGGAIYAHQLSAGIGTLVKDLELILSCCSAKELAASHTCR